MVAQRPSDEASGHPKPYSPSAFSTSQSSSLLTWLKSTPEIGKLLHASSSRPSLHASQFNYGQSNPTYLVTLSTASNVLSFVLRSQPTGKLLQGAHRIDREYKVLNALQTTSVPIPKPYAYCSDCHILGSEFYIMQYVVNGIIFRDASLRDLQNVSDRRQVYSEAVRVLSEIRRVDVDALGLSTLSRPSPPWIYRQIDVWYRQYQASRMPNGDYSSMEALYNRLITECGLRETNSVSGGAAHDTVRRLVHGDFRIDNLMFRRSADGHLICVAVLDWELASLGNPLADLSSLLVPYHMPRGAGDIDILQAIALANPRPAGIPHEDDIIAEYSRQILETRDLRISLNLYLAVALFKFAAIVYGVQCRAHQGNASSPSSALLGKQAPVFAEAGIAVLDGSFRLEDSQTGTESAGGDRFAQGLLSKVCSFMDKEVMPLEKAFFEHCESDRRWTPWQPMELLKSKAKACGLWNLFLPKSLGGKLSSAEYSPLAEVMGRCVFAPEVFNCSAPIPVSP